MNKDDQELFRKLNQSRIFMYLLPVDYNEFRMTGYGVQIDEKKTFSKYKQSDSFRISGFDYFLLCWNSFENVDELKDYITNRIRYLIKSEEREESNAQSAKKFMHRNYEISYTTNKKAVIEMIDLLFYTFEKTPGEKLNGFRALTIIDKLKFLNENKLQHDNNDILYDIMQKEKNVKNIFKR